MKTLYKCNFNSGHATYVIAEDLNSASATAEKKVMDVTGSITHKIVSIEIIAKEGRGGFNNTLHIAPEAQPEQTFDGPSKQGGIYS